MSVFSDSHPLGSFLKLRPAIHILIEVILICSQVERLAGSSDN